MRFFLVKNKSSVSKIKLILCSLWFYKNLFIVSNWKTNLRLIQPLKPLTFSLKSEYWLTTSWLFFSSKKSLLPLSLNFSKKYTLGFDTTLWHNKLLSVAAVDKYLPVNLNSDILFKSNFIQFNYTNNAQNLLDFGEFNVKTKYAFSFWAKANSVAFFASKSYTQIMADFFYDTYDHWSIDFDDSLNPPINVITGFPLNHFIDMSTEFDASKFLDKNKLDEKPITLDVTQTEFETPIPSDNPTDPLDQILFGKKESVLDEFIFNAFTYEFFDFEVDSVEVNLQILVLLLDFLWQFQKKKDMFLLNII